MSKDIMEYPFVRSLVKGWLALLIIGPLVVMGLLRHSAAPYQRDFKGMNEADVVALIGKPAIDEREGRSSGRFSLIWSYAWGSRLSLEFQDGVVVDQQRGSR